ncbi:hypothetical protein D1614_00405 [Maribellus luteus]|uniref:Addiction module protein n=1 Tax=Maribellus luteus TaxID=2305463 RepID=A0A399T3K7_9BACT|nr:hypothetical protein [Maribellus luteus]RIJ50438.1 hypothetical protein D1614_00405 [Maribellus luteus]
MGYDAVKLELIEWLAKLNDEETIAYLKIVKDSRDKNDDWWKDLSVEQKESIERGIRDVKEGRVFSHEEIQRKYGL